MTYGSIGGLRDWPIDLQDGVLTRAQALQAGVTDRVIAAHLRRGRWQRLYPGIYATFSGAPARNCLLWAATLRAGPRSVLSHQTAAELWELPGAGTTAIHITVPRGLPITPIPGVILHYSLNGWQARHPVLVPPRTAIEETVLDLATSAVCAEAAITWVFRAIASRRTTAELLAAALLRRRRIRWRTEIQLALAPVNSGVHSILEHRYLHRVERPHGLPAATRQRQVRRAGRSQYSDVAYDEYTTVVELDGRTAHPESTRHLDTARDNANIADGWVTLRYGWIEVSERSCELAAQMAVTLRRRGWTGAPRRCGVACRLPASLLPMGAIPRARSSGTTSSPRY